MSDRFRGSNPEQMLVKMIAGSCSNAIVALYVILSLFTPMYGIYELKIPWLILISGHKGHLLMLSVFSVKLDVEKNGLMSENINR